MNHCLNCGKIHPYTQRCTGWAGTIMPDAYGLEEIDPDVNSSVDEATDETPEPWDVDAGFPDEVEPEDEDDD